ncbi:ATP-binding protein [Candidatus Peregrinibacteria bacterium]|nr:ATP-binding protein [Candidatus Peregrinibacteria bacterium]
MRRRIHRHSNDCSNFSNTMSQYDSIIKRWVLRLLVEGDLNKSFIESNRHNVYAQFSNDDLAEFIGVLHLEDDELSLSEIRQKIEELWKKSEDNDNNDFLDSALEKNIEQLQQALNLSDLECEVLHFIILAKSYSMLKETVDLVDDVNTSQAAELIAIALNHPKGNVTQVLNNRSLLRRSALLEVESSPYIFSSKFELLSGLDDQLFSEQASVLGLVEHLITPAKPTSLTIADFDHLEYKLERVRAYLKEVMLRKTRGVNILLYGEPGVGKTDFVRTLIQDDSFGMPAELYELSVTDADDDAISGSKRFQAYRLSQKLLSNQPNTVILFDEIEDVFPNSSGMGVLSMMFGRGRSIVNQKGWINETLETNSTPAFWISNEVDQIDPAYLRRFDLAIEIPSMTANVRKRMLNKILDDLPVSSIWVNKMAHHKHLHPGQIKSAYKVVSHLNQTDNAIVERELEILIGETQQVMGNPPKPEQSVQTLTSYSLGYLNSSEDLFRVTKGLEKINSARICLYGKPGTGKSAYVQHLAKQLNQPLISKRASDLLGMYVGQTEKQIAQMFRQAEDEKAVLFLDEGDSFLRDRTGAGRSWEVTQVNELLVQMEKFEGIFIISTNLMDDLDAAALRRFDFKISFDYMTSEQSWQLFQQVAKDQQVDLSDGDKRKIKNQVCNLANLTPGDFITIVRRYRVLGGLNDAAEMVDALSVECLAKPDAKKRKIGFV